MTDREPLAVLVCGGRDFNDIEKLSRTLDELLTLYGVRKLVHGCAAGADRLADQWAESRKIKLIKRHPADWAKHGNAAGPIRNQEMLDDNRHLDVIVAFPGGRGTADMVRRARAAGIPILEIK